MSKEILVWDEDLKEQFLSDPELQSHSLFIENHPEFPAYLLVNSFDPLYPHSLKEVIGEYRAVHKLELNKLLDAAEENGYSPIIYTGDSNGLFSSISKLEEPLPIKLNVNLYPFQLRGFNYLKDLPSSIYNWSTGTGKGTMGVVWSKYLLETDKIDKVVVLVKSHNKYNWIREFESKADLIAHTDEEATGTNPAIRRDRRKWIYIDNQIIVINYEKLRFRPTGEKTRYDLTGRKMPSSSGDGQELLEALKDQRVAWILDEAPSKLKSMQTGWYKGLVKLQKATKENRTTALTATKLEKNPDDLYSWTKILDKNLWPSKTYFRSMYARRMFDWRVLSWDIERLPEIGMRLAHMTSKADKYLDPDIRSQFPEFQHEDVFVDLYPQERKVYEALRQEVINKNVVTISTLSPLQVCVNNMSHLVRSQSTSARSVADQFRPSDKNLAKMEKLRDMLNEIPGKVVIFSAFNDFGSQMLTPYLAKWGFRFVLYDGNAKQKQAAQDRFTQDLSVRIFVSSDLGSDSINLQEAASVIHFDLPWNASTFTQRQNRIHRITSKHSHVFSYSLIASNTLEAKKLKIIERKMKMESAVDQALDNQAELLGSFSPSELAELIS